MLPVQNSMVDKVPAESINQFYYSSRNTKRSKVDTYQTTNAVFSLNSLTSASTSTVVISPNSGMSHFILSASLPEPATASTVAGVNYVGLALPSGWLYNFIDNITYRYAGSSQWSATGEQLRVSALVNAGNAQEAQQILNLGGQALLTRADFTGSKLSAAIPLTLAHVSSQSGTSVPLPLDSSLLNGGPITITITWKDFSKVFARTQSAAVAPDIISNIPAGFFASTLQIRQIIMMFRDDQIKMGGDEAYRYPITFYQPANQVPLNTTVVGAQTVNLVGFKQGECRGVYCYVTKSYPDTSPVPQALNRANASTYVAIKRARMSYAGTVLHDYQSRATGALLDTLYNDSPSYFQVSSIAAANPAALGSYWVPAANPLAISYFSHFPFAQRAEDLTDVAFLMNGVAINNGSIALEIEIDETFDPLASYVVNYVPYFSAALSFSGGQVDYLF